MISLALARQLRDAGVRWDPKIGDRFVIADRDMDEDVFTLSDMTIEVHDFPGERIIGFNGTVEWALDSVEMQQSVWLPSETQLRELLAGTFRSLTRSDDAWLVTTQINGVEHVTEHPDATEAYGEALLHLITGC